MSDTPRFAMPLLDAAQAQKHVTVNEALMRADLLGAAGSRTATRAAPPAESADGDVHIVGAGATGDWAGHEGALALFLNGGWVFVAPWGGCAVWVAAERRAADLGWRTWVEGRVGGSPGGAATLARVVEIDHALSGAVSTTAAVIPDKAVVLGVTRAGDRRDHRGLGLVAGRRGQPGPLRLGLWHGRGVVMRMASPGSRRPITAARR